MRFITINLHKPHSSAWHTLFQKLLIQHISVPLRCLGQGEWKTALLLCLRKITYQKWKTALCHFKHIYFSFTGTSLNTCIFLKWKPYLYANKLLKISRTGKGIRSICPCYIRASQEKLALCFKIVHHNNAAFNSSH